MIIEYLKNEITDLRKEKEALLFSLQKKIDSSLF